MLYNRPTSFDNAIAWISYYTFMNTFYNKHTHTHTHLYKYTCIHIPTNTFMIT